MARVRKWHGLASLFSVLLVATIIVNSLLLVIVVSAQFNDDGLQLDEFRRLSMDPLGSRLKRAPTTTTTSTPTTKTKRPAKVRSSSAPETTTTTTTPNTKATNRLKSTSTKKPSKAKAAAPYKNKVGYDAKNVAYYLESHQAYNVHDPRAFFTEERTTGSLAIMLSEMGAIPKKLRFAFMVRVFNELGRKIASKLNIYTREIVALLNKAPDGLGSKPEVSTIVDAVTKAFESKEDNDPPLAESVYEPRPISSLLVSDKEKQALFNASVKEISSRFAHIVSYFVVTSEKNKVINVTSKDRDNVSQLLANSMKFGAKRLISEVSMSDKFRVAPEVVYFMEDILNNTIGIFKRHVRDSDDKVGDPTIKQSFQEARNTSFRDLNQISDKTGLIGAWNSYLFKGLGTSERVIKLFASLLSRVPLESKTRWMNMYMGQVRLELERTLSSFVRLQAAPHLDAPSEVYLLEASKKSSSSANPLIRSVFKPRNSYKDDKNRLPARCYLAGRRWRMLLMRALIGYEANEMVIAILANKIGELKKSLVAKTGNDLERLCLPRLEVGLRGWTIDGDPHRDEGPKANKFPLKNPIDGMNTVDDPFTSGIKLGYKIGFKLGYNEKRNATLEMESANSGDGKSDTEKAKSEVVYLGRASYRHGAIMGARKAFEIAIREGYLATLKISLRAGLVLPSEAGSRLASLKGTSFGGEAGKEAGRVVVNNYLKDKDFSLASRKAFTDVGEIHGLLGGQIMGDAIGAIVGKESAVEAYKRSIVNGAKWTRAKYHLDEFEAGAKDGLETGIKEGERVASSSNLDPSAPRELRFVKPVFSQDEKLELTVDHWEKELIPPLTPKMLEESHRRRNHTMVKGVLTGSYTVAKEVKKGMKRVSFSNQTYSLEVAASGFIWKGITYLTLNGKVDKVNILRGSLVTKDIFNN